MRNWKLGDDLRLDDNILDSMNFDELVVTAANSSELINGYREERRKNLRNIFEDLVEYKIREARDMFKNNVDEILAEIFVDECRKKKAEPDYPPEKSEDLARDIYNFLVESGLWMDVTVYYNGIAMSTSDKESKNFRYGGEPFIYEAEPSDYFDYVREPNILSMSFEGPLYEVLNYSYGILREDFDRIFRDYGLYYELGNAWNLSCYKV